MIPAGQTSHNPHCLHKLFERRRQVGKNVSPLSASKGSHAISNVSNVLRL